MSYAEDEEDKTQVSGIRVPTLSTPVQSPASGPRLNLLVVTAGTVDVRALPREGTLAVGRASGVDVLLDHPSVSRRHVLIHIRGAQIEVEDLGSANGTRLRSQPLPPHQRVSVQPGDIVELPGGTLMFQRAGVPGARRAWTHGYLATRFEGECERARYHHGTLALVRLRIDGADAAQIEEVLASHLRPLDGFAPYAGNEFEFLMVDATPDEVRARIREVEQAFERMGAKVKSGTATLPRDGLFPEALRSRVSAALDGDRRVRDERAPQRIVADPKMQQLYLLVDRVAQQDISVVLLGETGVGKEVIAEQVHQRSRRANRPLLRLNCAALPEQLLESELFGHEKGAFTGAVQAKMGLLESADGGTVFLDEIGEMPLSVQAKLLRVLEGRVVSRLGSLKEKRIDVRFIAATNRNLDDEIVHGRFRPDLYYRLNGIALDIPPLRERPSEIPLLARIFLERAARAQGRPTVPALTPQALKLLLRYRWPGNVRELRNLMDRAVLLAQEGDIGVEHLPADRLIAASESADVVTSPSAFPFSNDAPSAWRRDGDDDDDIVTSDEVVMPTGAASARRRAPQSGPGVPVHRLPEDAVVTAGGALPPGGLSREQILTALDRAGGNQTRAAELLGVSRRTLVYRLTALGLTRHRRRPPSDR